MTAEATAISAVAAQPMRLCPRLRVKRPMTLCLCASSMMTTMTGTATTPLTTALQNSAVIGSIEEKLRSRAMMIAAAMMP